MKEGISHNCRKTILEAIGEKVTIKCSGTFIWQIWNKPYVTNIVPSMDIIILSGGIQRVWFRRVNRCKKELFILLFTVGSSHFHHIFTIL